MLELGRVVINENLKKQKKVIDNYEASQNVIAPESATRHRKYLLDQISDQQLKNIARECNKALDATDNNNTILALFHTRKIIESILVYAIKANHLVPKASYRSATNLRICKRKELLDEDYIRSIDEVRELCGDNTHQLGYEDKLTFDQMREAVETICEIFDYVSDRYEPAYQA